MTAPHRCATGVRLYRRDLDAIVEPSKMLVVMDGEVLELRVRIARGVLEPVSPETAAQVAVTLSGSPQTAAGRR